MKLALLSFVLVLSAVAVRAQNLESLSSNGAASLIEAAAGFKAMLAQAADPSAKQKMLDEKLRSACSSIDTAEIRRLVAMGANPNAYNGYDFTPLTQAVASTGDTDVLKTLFELGAKADLKGTCDMTALHYAATYGRPEAAQLLVAHGADFNASSCVGETPLLEAAANGKKEVFSYLLGLGADVNKGRDYQGRTTLMTAINRSADPKDEILAALLAAPGLDANVRDNDGMTALKFAVKSGDLDGVKALLAVPGIDVNDDGGGTTALFLAELNKQDDIAAALRAAGGHSIAAR